MNGNERYLRTLDEHATMRGLKERIVQSVTKAYPNKATQIMGYLGQIKVITNLKAAKHGHAAYYRKELMLSANLLRVGTQSEQDETFLHEIAHFVDHAAEGRSCGHGENWKRIMRCLGLEPRRCKSLEAVQTGSADLTEQNAAVYECTDCGYQWGKSRRWTHSHPVNSGRWHPVCKRAGKPNAGAVYLASFKGRSTKHLWPSHLIKKAA